MSRAFSCVVITCVVGLCAMSFQAFSAGPEELEAEIRSLMDEEDEAFLLSEIRRIQPPL